MQFKIERFHSISDLSEELTIVIVVMKVIIMKTFYRRDLIDIAYIQYIPYIYFWKHDHIF